MADWNTSNQNRFYPFQTNYGASGLNNSEILDARFFIVNPSGDAPSVWLHSRENEETRRTYVFQNSEGGTMTFTVPDSEEAQCIWNTDEEGWNGYVVFGARS